MALTYFAQDGSYGDAAGIVILDTRAWSNVDWDRVQSAMDYRRVAEAVEVARLNGEEL